MGSQLSVVGKQAWSQRGQESGEMEGQQGRSRGDTAERRGFGDGVRRLFEQRDSHDRDSTSSHHQLQMGKLRHKPGSAAALQKGCPFPQHPTGHTEGVKVIDPPNLPGLQKGSGDIVSCWGVQSHALPPVLAQHPRCRAPIPARNPGIPHPIPARDPGIPHPSPQGTGPPAPPRRSGPG